MEVHSLFFSLHRLGVVQATLSPEKDLATVLQIQSFHFTDKETEARPGQAVHSGSGWHRPSVRLMLFSLLAPSPNLHQN